MLQDNPALLAIQEQAFRMSQLEQNALPVTECDVDKEDNKNGGSEYGEDEDGIGGHDSTEY